MAEYTGYESYDCTELTRAAERTFSGNLLVREMIIRLRQNPGLNDSRRQGGVHVPEEVGALANVKVE